MTGLSLDTLHKDLEPVSTCPFCGSAKVVERFEGLADYYFQADDGIFEYVRCKACASVWLTNRPQGARLMQAYRNYYTHEDSASTSGSRGNSVKETLRSVYVRSRYGRASRGPAALISGIATLVGKDHIGTDLLFRFAPKVPARVLDYGCGNGDYLLRLHSLGHDLSGVEFDAYLLERLSAHGIPVADVTDVDRLEWDAAFDHITLSHVLEHVPDPLDLLARLFLWLRPGGTIFVEVPNAEATGISIFGRYWRGFEAPRHFALPSRAALVESLSKAGFAGMRQFVGRTVRERMWEASLEPVDHDEAIAMKSKMTTAEGLTFDNAEFLTFLATKPHDGNG